MPLIIKKGFYLKIVCKVNNNGLEKHLLHEACVNDKHLAKNICTCYVERQMSYFVMPLSKKMKTFAALIDF